MPAWFCRILLFTHLLVPMFGDQELQSKVWRAGWVAPKDAAPRDYGVYHFRKHFVLAEVPSSVKICVSADQRYRLFVNGVDIGEGPARGDLQHWRFETYDLAPHLKKGGNVIAAQVWNQGLEAPIAQISFRTAFLLLADDLAYSFLDTGKATNGWKAIRNEAYSGISVKMGTDVAGYWAAGMMDRVQASRYPYGWEQVEFDDKAWPEVVKIADAAGRDARDAPSRWMLVPRTIPAMEKKPIRWARVRRSTLSLPENFPVQMADFTVPANSTHVILLDQNELTTGYPKLIVSGGEGATVQLNYAETLYEPYTNAWSAKKNHRDLVDLPNGKPMQLMGYHDEFLPDGGEHRIFRPLWWRTWRYLQLTIKTAAQPLVVHDLKAQSSMYPFDRKASFRSSDPELDRILEIGWRAARLCAHEHYMDCPYYEQLQYVGDTRVQTLISYFQTGDTRLIQNAIEQIDSSRTAEGLTLSRAPSDLQQYIPGFSLWWIGMLHDYSRYAGDPQFVKNYLPGMRQVISWWAARQQADGSMSPLPWWPYVDWVKTWKPGAPAAGPDGATAVHDLQLLLGYQYASDLEGSFGLKALGDLYRVEAGKLSATIQKKYWNTARGLYADNSEQKLYSQQANAMAILAGMQPAMHGRIAEKLLTQADLAPASVYFKTYLHEAVQRAGLGGKYVELLADWRVHLQNGLTTTPETAEPTRSDCHAWGASPNFDVFRVILGVDSAALGFSRLVIRPNLGPLSFAEGSIPHPKGEVRVKWQRVGQNLKFELETPVPAEIVVGRTRKGLALGKHSGQIAAP
jgi:alpha-L-rhamnosidase